MTSADNDELLAIQLFAVSGRESSVGPRWLRKIKLKARCDIGDCSLFPMLELAAYDILKVQAAALESGRRCGRVQMRA